MYAAEISASDAQRLAKAKPAPKARARFPARGPLSSFTKGGDGLLFHLWGGPGSGKTTIGYQSFADVHIISEEMRLDVVAAYCKRLGVVPASVSRPRWVEGGLEGEGYWDLGIPADHYGPVLLDSATSLGASADGALEQLDAHRCATGAPCIIIGQATKAGDAWGSAKLAHMVDVVIELVRDGARRYARCSKNRAGEVGTVDFTLGAHGAAAGVHAGRVYSVEPMRGGGYRLVAHPDDSAKWAEPWREAERDTPEGLRIRAAVEGGGYATAARASKLAPGGWALAGDEDERRRFAEDAGLEWYDPRYSASEEGS